MKPILCALLMTSLASHGFAKSSSKKAPQRKPARADSTAAFANGATVNSVALNAYGSFLHTGETRTKVYALQIVDKQNGIVCYGATTESREGGASMSCMSIKSDKK